MILRPLYNVENENQSQNPAHSNVSNPPIFGTVIDLLPKRELKPGDTMYEILNNWNKHRTSIERISKIGELKYKINEIQNVITECNKVNCYVCNN